MDRMRQEFEQWAHNYNLSTSDWGNYADRHINNMWRAWQASRTTLKVELPANCCGHAITVDELISLLEKSGIALEVGKQWTGHTTAS